MCKCVIVYVKGKLVHDKEKDELVWPSSGIRKSISEHLNPDLSIVRYLFGKPSFSPSLNTEKSLYSITSSSCQILKVPTYIVEKISCLALLELKPHPLVYQASVFTITPPSQKAIDSK